MSWLNILFNKFVAELSVIVVIKITNSNESVSNFFENLVY